MLAAMVSSTSRESWGTKATWVNQESSSTSEASTSSSRYRPESGCRRRSSSWIRVDFPPPDGPMMPTASPRRTSKSRSETAAGPSP